MKETAPEKTRSRGQKIAIIAILIVAIVLVLASRNTAVRAHYYTWRMSTEMGRGREPSMTALVEMGSAAVPALREVLSNGSPDTRAAAADALGRINTPEASRALTGAIDDPSELVRMAAVRAMDGKTHPGVREAIEQALREDEAGDVRMAAILALLGTSDASVLPTFRKALEDPRADVRRMAVFAIAALPPDFAIPELIEALRLEASSTRSEVVSRLADTDPELTLKLLFEKLESDPGIAESVRQTVEMIAGEDPGAQAPEMHEWWETNRKSLLPGEAEN